MDILDVNFDHVINGVVLNSSMSYREATEKLVPLINKTDFQRKLQDKKFYQKLERDIIDGCIMPPITIAFVNHGITRETTEQEILNFFNQNYKKSFVLDGIQRLNTLSRVVNSKSINLDGKIYINIIFSDSIDKLLYRMITLNNGQKPMTPRHQVEVMMANVFDFKALGLLVQSEKDRANKIKMNAFNKSDLIQAYLAYMADSPMVDNKKIIEEKMDNLIVNKIITSDPLPNNSSFETIVNAIVKFQKSPIALKWLKQVNNLVGFAVGMKRSSEVIYELSVEEFERIIILFEEVFSDFNKSKIKMGKLRRELTYEYFKNFNKLRNYGKYELLEYFSEITND